MNPTAIVYDSWLYTGNPITFKTTNQNGETTEKQCYFMNPLQHKYFKESLSGICTICGEDISGGFQANRYFSSNYTDWGIHKEPEATGVCKSCAFTMLLNVESGRMALSRYSFCAHRELELLSLKDARKRIANPPNPPFVLVVATSQKKHLAIKAKTSYSRDYFYCNLEENVVAVNRIKAETYLNVMESLRGIGFSKEQIKNKSLPFDKLKKYEMSGAQKIEELYASMNEKTLFDLCLHVAQKNEEEESICYLNLTRKMLMQPPQHSSSMQHTSQETGKEDQVDTKCGGKSKGSRKRPRKEQLTLDLF